MIVNDKTDKFSIHIYMLITNECGSKSNVKYSVKSSFDSLQSLVQAQSG